MIARQVGKARVGESLFPLGTLVANAAVSPSMGLMHENVRCKGRSLPREQDVGLVQAVEWPDQPQVAAHRLVQESLEVSKEVGRAVGKGFDPRLPRARFSISRSRHQTAALTVSRRLRPGR